MRLGGWHRLYLVVSVLYLVVIGGIVAIGYSSPKDVKHNKDFYKRLAPESLEKILGKGSIETFLESKEDVLSVEMPNGHVISFSAKHPREELEAVSQEYWNIVKKISWEKNKRLFFLAFLWWVVPCVALYILGWSVGWVIRGFHHSS